MLRFCAFFFTSGETLEIVLHTQRDIINILSIDKKYFPFSAKNYSDLDTSSSKETPEIFSEIGC